jgi:hypothetical protein
VPTSLVRNNPEEMEGLGVVRLGLKDVLVELLGTGKVARLVVLQSDTENFRDVGHGLATWTEEWSPWMANMGQI